MKWSSYVRSDSRSSHCTAAKKLVPRPGYRYSIKRFNFPRPEGIIPRKGTVTKNGEGLGIRANGHGGGPVAEILTCFLLTRNLKLESRA